jgi:hypothetical protein
MVGVTLSDAAVIAVTLLRGSTDCSNAARGVFREPSRSVSVGVCVPSLRPIGQISGQEIKRFLGHRRCTLWLRASAL